MTQVGCGTRPVARPKHVQLYSELTAVQFTKYCLVCREPLPAIQVLATHVTIMVTAVASYTITLAQQAINYSRLRTYTQYSCLRTPRGENSLTRLTCTCLWMCTHGLLTSRTHGTQLPTDPLLGQVELRKKVKSQLQPNPREEEEVFTRHTCSLPVSGLWW